MGGVGDSSPTGTEEEAGLRLARRRRRREAENCEKPLSRRLYAGGKQNKNKACRM